MSARNVGASMFGVGLLFAVASFFGLQYRNTDPGTTLGVGVLLLIVGGIIWVIGAVSTKKAAPAEDKRILETAKENPEGFAAVALARGHDPETVARLLCSVGIGQSEAAAIVRRAKGRQTDGRASP